MPTATMQAMQKNQKANVIGKEPNDTEQNADNDKKLQIKKKSKRRVMGKY